MKTWCHPGANPKQQWVLMFDDADRVSSIYENQEDALEAFNRAETMGWNCHLFTSVRRPIDTR